MNLLQSAGFSRSNPYYIVPQGRITALCNAKDSDRLALLKEVAGTRVYEEHRLESMKIMDETERKRSKIVELLDMINERLLELDEEKSELEGFMEVDKERRAVEYALWSKQLADNGKSIEELGVEEQSMIASLAAGEKERSLVESQLSQLNQIEAQMIEQKSLFEEALREKSIFEMEREDLLKQITQMEISAVNVSSKQVQSIETQLKKQAQEVIARESQLTNICSSLKTLTAKQDKFKLELQSAETQKAAIKSKQSRSLQFKTPAERDKWIKQEIAGLTTTLELSRRQLATLREETKSAEAQENDISAMYSTKQSEDMEFRKIQADSIIAYKQVKEKRDAVIEARKEGWRAEAKLEQTIKSVSEELDRWERTLSFSMDRSCFMGLQAIDRMAAQYSLQDKVYGPICDLISCDPVFRTAIEAVAGNALFHVIVEDEDVAVQLMDALVKEKCGRLTFIPLNLMCPSDHNMLIESEDAISLISKIQFDSKFSTIMNNIFGKTLLVPELGKPTPNAEMDRVTLSGDRQSFRGPIVGGYVDNKKSRLEAVFKLREWRERDVNCKQQLTSIRSKLSSLEQSLLQLTTQLHILDRQQSTHSSASELADLERQLQGVQDILRLKSRTIVAIEQRIGGMVERIEALNTELGAPLNNGPGESDGLIDLEEYITKVVSEYNQTNEEITKCLQEELQLRSVISNAKETRITLLDRIAEISRSSSDAETLTKYNQNLAITNERLELLSSQIDEHSQAVRRLEDAMEKAQSIILTSSSTVSSQMERFLSKRSYLLSQREEFQKHIREIGVVSEEVVVKYSGYSIPLLTEQLHKHSDVLKKNYSHVNKRAREQHAQYTKQSEDLVGRKSELDAAAVSITEFTKTLDTKKDEAILRTFDQVSQAFSQIFSELGGMGALEIVRDSSSDFVGISVNVSSFGMPAESPADDAHLLKQLSGGQKSLVALALILAIQRVDPAPFYLFDEVDAALDAHHRSALASLLRRAESTQYIITTFRPELVMIGDSHWGVSGGGGGSRIDNITKDTALQFIEHV